MTNRKDKFTVTYLLILIMSVEFYLLSLNKFAPAEHGLDKAECGSYFTDASEAVFQF